MKSRTSEAYCLSALCLQVCNQNNQKVVGGFHIYSVQINGKCNCETLAPLLALSDH